MRNTFFSQPFYSFMSVKFPLPDICNPENGLGTTLTPPPPPTNLASTTLVRNSTIVPKSTKMYSFFQALQEVSKKSSLLNSMFFLGLDVDECRLDSAGCSRDADCINTEGSYSCKCLSGFTGDGFTCKKGVLKEATRDKTC